MPADLVLKLRLGLRTRGLPQHPEGDHRLTRGLVGHTHHMGAHGLLAQLFSEDGREWFLVHGGPVSLVLQVLGEVVRGHRLAVAVEPHDRVQAGNSSSRSLSSPLRFEFQSIRRLNSGCGEPVRLLLIAISRRCRGEVSKKVPGPGHASSTRWFRPERSNPAAGSSPAGPAPMIR
ncbi:hypothetical protein GCM10022223_10190 [Kineosporia mesophila]|uniref:Uncharacterized protein n=1 Tax=Kineosporia mesophila TaxID=566012 RepID=A0ABP6Z2W3_9ACTN